MPTQSNNNISYQNGVGDNPPTPPTNTPAVKSKDAPLYVKVIIVVGILTLLVIAFKSVFNK